MNNKANQKTYIDLTDETPQIGYGEEEAQKRKRIQKRRRGKRIKNIFIGVLILISIGAGWAAATLENQVSTIFGKMDRDPRETLASVNLDDVQLTYDNQIINILLIGADKRSNWAESGRSDSVMIATLDLKNKRIKLTSLMRDLYVTIPGYGENRFNAAYSFGGVSLVYQTIASNFGIKMDGYVVVDFAAFKKVIDKLGGVEIELTEKEHRYLTTAYKKGSVLKLLPGINNMNGTQALAYTRIRQDAQGDFGRTGRQRKVLQSIFLEIKAMPYSKLLGLIEEIMPYIKTDLGDEQIISYLKDVILLGTTTIDEFRIPMDDSYVQKRIDNMAVLVPELSQNIDGLHQFIFEYNGE